MARILGWFVALAVAPFVLRRFRRGWSRLRDLGEVYVLMAILVWGLSIAHAQRLRLPNVIDLIEALAVTVLYWFGLRRRISGPWLEPGADRLPTAFERLLIRFAPVMEWVLAVEAGVVGLLGTWLGRYARPVFPVSVILFVATIGLYVIAARGWREAGRFL